MRSDCPRAGGYPAGARRKALVGRRPGRSHRRAASAFAHAVVGAAAVAADHVTDAGDLGFGEHGPDELDLARAGLTVAVGDRGDRAVVLDDDVVVGAELVVGGEIAVVVEDRR